MIEIGLGLVLLVLGGILTDMLAWPYNLIGVGIMAVGMAAIILGTLWGYEAMDPPVPDFRRGLPEAARPLGWALPETERGTPADAAMTLVQLLDRLLGATHRVGEARDRAWGAHIDGDEPALDALRQAAWRALESMRHVARGIANAVDELEPQWQELRETSRSVIAQPAAPDLGRGGWPGPRRPDTRLGLILADAGAELRSRSTCCA